MMSNPRSPTPSRRAAGWALRVAVMLSLGVAAYFGLELTDSVLMDRLSAATTAGPVEVVELPPQAETPVTPSAAPRSEGPGNRWVRHAAAALEEHESITVRLDQRGWIDGQAIETSGRYYQLGAASSRRFLLEQTGQLAGAPTRLLRVSDSRLLWTDLAWGDPSQPQRSVTRVDLRKVRRALTDDEAGGQPTVDPTAWSRFGGLPMLLSGLDENFSFGAAQRKQLRDRLVVAMVGRWRPERLEELMAGDAAKGRAPHHVVIALDEATSFPLLVEYRDARDPLSAAGLADEALLTSSRRPLLKMDIAAPTFGERLDPRLFTYNPSDDSWADQTDRELRLVQAAETLKR